MRNVTRIFFWSLRTNANPDERFRPYFEVPPAPSSKDVRMASLGPRQEPQELLLSICIGDNFDRRASWEPILRDEVSSWRRQAEAHVLRCFTSSSDESWETLQYPRIFEFPSGGRDRRGHGCSSPHRRE